MPLHEIMKLGYVEWIHEQITQMFQIWETFVTTRLHVKSQLKGR